MNISLYNRDTNAQLCFGQADESVRKMEIDERGTVHIWKDGSNNLINIHHFGTRFLVSVEPTPKPESSELRAIAHECAGFARDNYDEDDSDELNYTLTPDAIWQGWHSKDGIEAPAMPAEFPVLYYRECEAQYGADFADDIRALSQPKQVIGKCDLCGSVDVELLPEDGKMVCFCSAIEPDEDEESECAA